MNGRIRNLARRMLPPPRRPVRWGDALPLGIFFVLFAAAWLSLELTRTVRFSSPGALLLLVATPWIWWMHAAAWSGLPRGRAVVALMVRLLLVGLFTMLFADPQALRTSDALGLVYAIDLSDSTSEAAQDDAIRFVAKTVAEKPAADEAGLVVFGRNAAVELPVRMTLPLESETAEISSRVLRDGTDLEEALSLAGACLPDDHHGRIVLVTDGVATEGDTFRALEDLAARNVPVDVLPIQYAYEREVWLERLDLPHITKVGATYEAAVVLSSLASGTGTLTLSENGREIFKGDVTYGGGKSRYAFPLYTRAAGYYEYMARISVPEGEDGRPENNVAINHLYLAGEGRILIAVDPAGEAANWQSLEKAIADQGRAVERTSVYELQHDALSLMPYDCIVLPNVPADAFDAAQMEAVRAAVYNHGTGLLMVGGKNSYGPGGWNRTAIEQALPVTMDITQKKVMPKGALAIILHTCEFAEGNTWAKRITKEAMRVLGSRDDVGVLAYDYQGGEKWIFHLTPAGKYDELAPLVNNAQIGDMPSFQNTMQMGLDGLLANDAAAKHLIVISDGDPSPPTPSLIARFQNGGVSISTVAINPHGGSDISVMKAIAAATGGRYYFVDNPDELPSIFIKEAKTLRRSMIQNRTFVPTLDFPSPVMKGIDSIPPMHGYVIATPKSRSVIVLSIPSEDDTDPLLATWRYGIGTAAAFTSDLATNWGKDWVLWDKYQSFVKQLMDEVSRVAKRSNLSMRTYIKGSTGVVTVEDFDEGHSFLQVQARVEGPRGRALKLTLEQVAPWRYETTFPLWGEGRYHLTAAAAGGDRAEQTWGGFVLPYSQEYLRFRSDPAQLRRIAEITGGRVLTGTETGVELFGADRRVKERPRPIDDWFLIALAVLLVLDVGVRRVQLDLLVIRRWLGLDARGASDATLGALLEKKKALASVATTEDRAAVRLESSRAVRRMGKKKDAAARPKAQAQPAADAKPTEELSTTERLLRLKKRWKDDQK